MSYTKISGLIVAVFVLVAGCTPVGVQHSVDPFSNAGRCTQTASPGIAGTAVTLAAEGGQYWVTLIHTHGYASRTPHAFARIGESGRVQLLWTDTGEQLSKGVRGTSNENAARSLATFAASEAEVQQLLATTGEVLVRYTGMHGSFDAPIAPTVWGSLREGFGVECL